MVSPSTTDSPYLTICFPPLFPDYDWFDCSFCKSPPPCHSFLPPVLFSHLRNYIDLPPPDERSIFLFYPVSTRKVLIGLVRFYFFLGEIFSPICPFSAIAYGSLFPGTTGRHPFFLMIVPTVLRITDDQFFYQISKINFQIKIEFFPCWPTPPSSSPLGFCCLTQMGFLLIPKLFF